MKAQKTKSEHAAAAAAMKSECQKAYPGIKFRAYSDIFANGTSAGVEWVDGPTVEMVEKITDKYQYGSFDGMQDIYNYDNANDSIPQVKYTHADRQMSEETKQLIIFDLCAEFGFNTLDYDSYREELHERVCTSVYRKFVKLDLSK